MFVFAYGSLLWNPGFLYEEALPALAPGWQRSWCVRSTVHRGTPQLPGFVLGLIPGKCCVGMAYRVPREQEAETRLYLHGREMAETGYRPEKIGIELPTGRAEALCYIADRPCVATAEELSRAASTAKGVSGRNADYLWMALEALQALRIPDGWPCPCPGLPEGMTLYKTA